jgi:hypothetical protein
MDDNEKLLKIEEDAEKLNEVAKKEAKRIHERRLDDLRWILSKEQGRRYIWWLFGECGTFRTVHVPKDNDMTYINIGKVDIGLALLTDIQDAGSQFYGLMRKECMENILKNTKKETE